MEFHKYVWIQKDDPKHALAEESLVVVDTSRHDETRFGGWAVHYVLFSDLCEANKEDIRAYEKEQQKLLKRNIVSRDNIVNEIQQTYDRQLRGEYSHE